MEQKEQGIGDQEYTFTTIVKIAGINPYVDVPESMVNSLKWRREGCSAGEGYEHRYDEISIYVLCGSCKPHNSLSNRILLGHLKGIEKCKIHL